MICPNCGKDCVCKNCGYLDPDIWMRSHHDFETEVALADNVAAQMFGLWETLTGASTFPSQEATYPPKLVGAFMYRITKPTPNAPSGRVVRILESIYRARGNTFTRPKNYTERRDSDKKTLAGWKSSHRIKEVA